jgi:hypothetical protein
MVFVQGLSIITVCIPYIRNMLLSMESGMIQTGHFRLLNRHSLETAIPLRHIHIDSTSTNSFGNVDTQLQQPAACYGEKGTHK